LRALLLALPLLAGSHGWAAELTTREVVSALFKAAPGSQLDLSGKDLRRLDLAGVDFKVPISRGRHCSAPISPAPI